MAEINKIDFNQVTDEHYDISVTYSCNWQCDYCISDTHNQKQITHQQVLNQIEDVPCNSIVSLSGGEPGMVEHDLLESYLIKLKEKNCVVTVDTNGTILEKYPDLINKYIDDVLYHCTSYVKDRKPFIEYNFDHIPKNLNFVYQLVITNDDTLEDIQYYLDKYPDITFSIVGTNHCKVNGKAYKGLNRSKGFKIYQTFKDRLFIPHAPLLFLDSQKHENCISAKR